MFCIVKEEEWTTTQLFSTFLVRTVRFFHHYYRLEIVNLILMEYALYYIIILLHYSSILQIFEYIN